MLGRKTKKGSVDDDEAADGPEESAAPDKKRRRRGKQETEVNALTEWIKSLVVAFVLFIVIRTFLLQTFVITSGSMEVLGSPALRRTLLDTRDPSVVKSGYSIHTMRST